MVILLYLIFQESFTESLAHIRITNLFLDSGNKVLMASFFHKTQEGNGRSGLVLWFVHLDSWVTIAKWENVIPSCGVSLPLPDAFEVS